MALYSHQEATLADLNGSGYLFRKRSPLGDEYKGVFFGPEGEAETLEALVEDEPVTFSGVLYKKNRSGKVTSEQVELSVDVTSFREVSLGDRALIEAIDV
ncbi:MAG: hypothetical protein JJ896_05775 [Rhodothermales bacterium]|nr:hypothetical protein [Rhodothermales bacterium]MBO6779140.1 hypothetical protein [Rhodothermales bacterium]